MKSCSLILLFCMLVLCSCKKYPDNYDNPQKTIIYGNLIDAFFNRPIVNGKIYAKNYVEGSGNQYTIIDSTTTDNNGNYESAFIGTLNEKYGNEYSIWVYCDGYIMYARSESPHIGAINNLNFKFYPNAYINFKIKNVNPYDKYDHIAVELGPGAMHTVLSEYGMNIDTSIIVPVWPNTDHEIFWYYLKNDNFSIDYYEKIYCSSNDTSLCVINY